MEFHQENDQEQEDELEEMPHPINSTFGHNNNNKNNHIVPLSQHRSPNTTITTANATTTITSLAPPPPSSSLVVVVRYKECLKNHAASLGGKATDGCGEFMPSGEESTLKAFICSVCNCHRNFHRKEIEGDHYYHHLKRFDIGNNGRNLILQGHPTIEYNHNINNNNNNNNNNNVGALVPSRGAPHHMIMSYNMGMGSFPSESTDLEDGGGGFTGIYLPLNPSPPAPLQQVVKKRFRTKFTQQQKEKMVNFAEKVGWKIQRQEESLVQEFCQEIGIKRRVLKVWMHNNKQNLAKNTTNSISIYPPQDPNHLTT